MLLCEENMFPVRFSYSAVIYSQLSNRLKFLKPDLWLFVHFQTDIENDRVQNILVETKQRQ